MKIVTKALAVASTIGAYFTFASLSFADTASSFLSPIKGTGSTSLLSFITDALNLIISLSALIAVGVLIYSGIRYIIAAGDEKKVEEATKGITFAVVGLVICFIAVIVVRFVLQKLLQTA